MLEVYFTKPECSAIKKIVLYPDCLYVWCVYLWLRNWLNNFFLILLEEKLLQFNIITINREMINLGDCSANF